MSAQCVTGPAKPRRLFKRRRITTAFQAQRIRFGILAARHELTRGRLTPDQVEDLEGMELVGWRHGDAGTWKAYGRESDRIHSADFWAGWDK